MKTVTVFLLMLSTLAVAQKPDGLNNSFQQLKSKAQTYKDYKVIKETTLNVFWKLVEDTLAFNAKRINEAKQEIASLKTQIAQVKAEVQKREEAVAEIVFDSTHITFFGIGFHKAVFKSIVLIVLASLAGLLALAVMRGVFQYRSLKEKSEAVLLLNSEFEEYRHRAVEKQMKLSRELQNERNKLSEVKISR